MLRRPTPAMSAAARTMLALNPNVLIGREGSRECFIEDVQVDGRWFRLEYQCDVDGRRALAYCRHNPFGGCPFSALDSHLMRDGSLCTSDQAHRGGDDLGYTVPRARFWCVAYTFLREHGLERTRAELGTDW